MKFQKGDLIEATDLLNEKLHGKYLLVVEICESLYIKGLMFYVIRSPLSQTNISIDTVTSERNYKKIS